MSWIDDNGIFLGVPVDQLLAITAWAEARADGAEGMMAVLNVIRNRTGNVGEFGDPDIYAATGSPYHAVILKQWQFSPYNLNDPQRTRVEQLALGFNSALTTDVNLKTAYDLAKMLTSGVLQDNTGGSTHFHATYVTPQWASIFPMVGQVGSHLFYKAPVVLASIVKSPATMMFLTGLAFGIAYLVMRRRK